MAWPTEGIGASTSIAPRKWDRAPDSARTVSSPMVILTSRMPSCSRTSNAAMAMLPLLDQAELPIGPLSSRMQGGGERGADHLIGLEPGEGGTTAPELVDAFDG